MITLGKMTADHQIHGGWGNHIEWRDPHQFKDWDGSVKKFDVWGHLPVHPKVGETILGEFENSFIKFRFVDVKHARDPKDMFFAKVEPIEQEVKIAA